MTWILRFLPKKYLIIVGALAAVSALIWFQHDRIQSIRADLSEAEDQLEQEISDRRAAEKAVSEAVERAERLAVARDAAQKRLTDRMAAVNAVKGACLEMPLPAGLLD